MVRTSIVASLIFVTGVVAWTAFIGDRGVAMANAEPPLREPIQVLSSVYTVPAGAAEVGPAGFLVSGSLSPTVNFADEPSRAVRILSVSYFAIRDSKALVSSSGTFKVDASSSAVYEKRVIVQPSILAEEQKLPPVVVTLTVKPREGITWGAVAASEDMVVQVAQSELPPHIPTK
jgi:hypothetical protein